MNPTKLLFALLGALAISAAMAASVQADEWMIEYESLSGLKLKEEKVSLVSKPVTLSVPGFSLTITCEKAEGSGKIFEGGSAELTAALKTCTTQVGKGEKVCSVSEPLTIEGKTQSVLTNKIIYEKLEPLKGEALATVTLTGAECPLPGKSVVKGSIAAEVPATQRTEWTMKFSEKITETVNKELKGEKASELKLTFGTQSAKLSGEIIPKLSGANAGKNWRLARPTRWCLINENPCLLSSYGMGTTVKIQNTSVVKFKYGLVEAVCSEFIMEGSIGAMAIPVVGSITTVTVNNCSWESKECTVIPLATPYRFTSFREDGPTGNGLLILSGTNNMTTLKFKIVCGGKTCIYGADFLFWGNITGGAPAAMSTAPNPPQTLDREEASEPSCQASVEVEGGAAGETAPLKSKIAAPSPLFVTS